MNPEVVKHHPFHSPFDPCPPLPKFYFLPPQLFLGFQPYGLEQFTPREALKNGTLWPALYSPYESPYEHGKE